MASEGEKITVIDLMKEVRTNIQQKKRNVVNFEKLIKEEEGKKGNLKKTSSATNVKKNLELSKRCT
jgi:hypothetical protein